MATESTHVTRTRRAVLGAALGGAAAVAAQSIAPLAAKANVLPQVDLGGPNTATALTSIENTTDAQASFEGLHSAAGTGVFGTSLNGTGIQGTATRTLPTDWTNPPAGEHATGLYGVSGPEAGSAPNTNETGVYGFGNIGAESAGVWGDSVQGFGVYGSSANGFGFYGFAPFAVYGFSTASAGIGVFGDAPRDGTGVVGWTGNAAPVAAPPIGVGVWATAETTAQTALQVSGRIRLSRSGRKSIGRSSTSAKVVMPGVTTSSYVVATLQTSVTGAYVRAVVPASGSFTIYLSKAPGRTVVVGYVVIN